MRKSTTPLTLNSLLLPTNTKNTNAAALSTAARIRKEGRTSSSVMVDEEDIVAGPLAACLSSRTTTGETTVASINDAEKEKHSYSAAATADISQFCRPLLVPPPPPLSPSRRILGTTTTTTTTTMPLPAAPVSLLGKRKLPSLRHPPHLPQFFQQDVAPVPPSAGTAAVSSSSSSSSSAADHAGAATTTIFTTGAAINMNNTEQQQQQQQPPPAVDTQQETGLKLLFAASLLQQQEQQPILLSDTAAGVVSTVGASTTTTSSQSWSSSCRSHSTSSSSSTTISSSTSSSNSTAQHQLQHHQVVGPAVPNSSIVPAHLFSSCSTRPAHSTTFPGMEWPMITTTTTSSTKTDVASSSSITANYAHATCINGLLEQVEVRTRSHDFDTSMTAAASTAACTVASAAAASTTAAAAPTTTREEEEEEEDPTDVVETPTSSDVLCGRGTIIAKCRNRFSF
jgi:trimeric autotransporter adhesin